MPQISATEFLDLVKRSRLVSVEDLDQAIGEAGLDPADGTSNAEHVAQRLIDQHVLTRWQAQKILSRKYKGFLLGKYRLRDQIGSGGMSRVYLAEHMLLKQPRAVKVLPRDRVSDSSYLARFQLEAQATASLDHPNIARAYDLDHIGDIHFLVMEYIPGSDLQSLVKNQGPLVPYWAADYIAQAARGLAYAHAAGIVHRDIKPGNLLIDPQGLVKILDLGLALLAESDSSLTIAHAESVLGTADYLAPEQAVNSHLVDGRADIYSLGCSLYYALTGRPPFPDGTLAQRIARHQNESPPALSQLRPDCPAELEAICCKMMQKSPAERYQDADEVADALEAWLDSVERPTALAPPHEMLPAKLPGGRPQRPGSRIRPGGSTPRLPSRTLDDTVSEKEQETFKGLPNVSRESRAAPSDAVSSSTSRLSRRDSGPNPPWTQWMLVISICAAICLITTAALTWLMNR